LNSSLPETQALAKSVRPNWQGWLQASILFALVLLLYRGVFALWAEQLWTDENYSHCFLIPIFCAWVVWQNRARFKDIPIQSNWLGLPLIAASLGLLLIGVLGNENFLARLSFLFLIAGILIQFCGWKYFRAALFSWAVLFLMVPLPRMLFSQLTMPLQFLSSRLGSALLNLASVPNVREGNLIHLHSLTLDVAEACSGLRSLMSLIAVSIFYGYFFEFKAAQKWLLVFSAIPVAIVANGIRIMGTGVTGQYWGRDKSEGFFHSFSGIVVFFASFMLLIALGQAYRWAERSVKVRTAA